MTVTLHRRGGHTITCTSPIIGATLLRIFDHDRLVLVSVTTLKNGDAHRRYRPVSRDGAPYELDHYEEIHSPNRELLARITPA